MQTTPLKPKDYKPKSYIRVAFNNAKVVQEHCKGIEPEVVTYPPVVVLEFQTEEVSPELRQQLDKMFPNMAGKVYDLLDKEVVLQSMGVR